jgi:putative ABC transport system ATP-binding protein
MRHVSSETFDTAERTALNSAVVVDARGLTQTYLRGQQRVVALEDVSFQLRQGSVTAVVGPSGSGKSTLLHILAGLSKPEAGDCRVAGKNILQLGSRALARYRNRDIGVVFQAYNLLPGLTVEENVFFPLYFGAVHRHEGLQRVEHLLESVGLLSAAKRRPSQLSGGEQQRVAIARALVTNPSIILADEPTGNLDEDTGMSIANLMFRLAREYAKSLILVTHDRTLARLADSSITLANGHLVSEG